MLYGVVENVYVVDACGYFSEVCSSSRNDAHCVQRGINCAAHRGGKRTSARRAHRWIVDNEKYTCQILERLSRTFLPLLNTLYMLFSFTHMYTFALTGLFAPSLSLGFGAKVINAQRGTVGHVYSLQNMAVRKLNPFDCNKTFECWYKKYDVITCDFQFSSSWSKSVRFNVKKFSIIIIINETYWNLSREFQRTDNTILLNVFC